MTRTLRHTLAANLRRHRQARGLSQQALADKAKLYRARYEPLERGECNISIDNIERLAWALNVNPAELVRR